MKLAAVDSGNAVRDLLRKSLMAHLVNQNLKTDEGTGHVL
jgi:hypothetical protein